MIAFHGDTDIKAKYVDRVLWHRKMDYITQGTGYKKDANGKVTACAVGCTLENYNHKQYEIELGIPEWLARVEDAIFEGLPKNIAVDWPARFLSAINVGTDLEKVKTPFLIFILEQNLKYLDACVFDRAANPGVVKALEGSKAAVQQMIEAHRSGEGLEAAYSAADSARSAARSAAYSAADSAADSAYSARSAADSAAYSAADSARSAAYSAADSAYSARSAADSAAYSAADSARSAAYSAADSAAYSARSAAYSARSAAYETYADKLIELIKECK